MHYRAWVLRKHDEKLMYLQILISMQFEDN